MNHHSIPSQRPEGIQPGRPGRKLGPISDEVGIAHRAWLEPLRDRFLASGTTIKDLSARSGFSRSKISELLRGVGLYPRWEITHSLLHVLGIPSWPMRRLWMAAAAEANKKRGWVEGCIEPVVVSTGPSGPPLDHTAFVELSSRPYLAYAGAFLRRGQDARRAVTETFDILWLRWDEARLSPDVVRFAWTVLRRSVMARTPTVGGRPELVAAAFDTVALSLISDTAARFAQVEESMILFRAMSQLPDHQLDVMVLQHLCGLTSEAAADVLGVPIASVRSAARHARHSLAPLFTPAHPQEEPSSDPDR